MDQKLPLPDSMTNHDAAFFFEEWRSTDNAGLGLSSCQRHTHTHRPSLEEQKHIFFENKTLRNSIIHITLALHHCKWNRLCYGGSTEIFLTDAMSEDHWQPIDGK
ncbi:hypothetical protein TNCV_1319651 [Trichonephila clavipes]|nr:hypothetical protein TNCV_1319651 [Trichonephila clavipes]